MHRIDTANARPNQNGTGKAGFNDNTDLAGQDATYLDPDWCNGVQEEIAAVVEDHATLVKGNNGQLKAALYAIFSTKVKTQEVDDRLSTAIVALGVAMQQAIIDERNAERNRIWPIGKGRHTTYDGLNPAHASHLGFGTWMLDTAAAGRVDIGAGAITIDYSDATGDAARANLTRTFAHGDTGGELDHKQTLEELTAHKHSEGVYNKFGARASDALAAGDVVDQQGDGIKPTTVGADSNNGESEIQVADISNTQFAKMAEKERGDSQPFNVMQPYRVVSVWVRTA